LKEQGEDGAVLSGCGMLFTVVGPHGASSFPLLCKTWRCPKCRKKLIADYIDKIRHNFMKLPCVQVFVGYRTEKGKDLSNFTSQNVSGHYCQIGGMDISVIISDRKFDGVKRFDKIKFLRKTIPEILNQPWDKGRRISFSLGWIETEVKPPPKYWAMIDGDVCIEFYKLLSDEEKKAWLNKQKIYQMYPKGKKFLNQEFPSKGKQIISAEDILKGDIKAPQSGIQGILRQEPEPVIVTGELLDAQFPPSWRHYDETTLERLAIMTVDGGLSDEEAIKEMGRFITERM
jgi:hypothetical protein